MAEKKIEEDEMGKNIMSLIECMAADGCMYVTLDDTDYTLTYDIAKRLISDGFYISGNAIFWD
ncbi:hypothetical protein KL86DPRO_20269 [uncultured delta proteobacterium]|uniref:Uncharacterized protein n=1 Tax=uncultured delta proteobacterium TaxID=34034 RepID=A0A212JXN2_9DELT|nr:hypothetical protein KL86DPRO_20269 [uncultured delta proteobacterium]